MLKGKPEKIKTKTRNSIGKKGKEFGSLQGERKNRVQKM